ncbi:MAG TPA: hypothetical protein VMV17_03405 [Streptosporangiaceae bacterium]|nr:hypothetical protein [Streptosporangiaceae bacterium]
MLRASRELLALRSPLDAELMVSEMLGTWWGQRAPRSSSHGAADLEELIGEGLVEYAAQHASPAALALLSGIACLGTPRQAVQAEQAGLALIERGVARPAWSEHVGAVAATDCYLNSDLFGDQDEAVCLFSYAGTDPHALVMVVDYNAGGILRDGWVTSKVSTLLERCQPPGDTAPRQASGAQPARAARGGFRPVTPAQARRLLEAALTATDTATDPPVSKSFPAYHAFIRARVRTLSPKDPVADPAIAPFGGPATALASHDDTSGWISAAARRKAWSDDRRAMLVVEFLASDDAEDLSDRKAASRCADHIIAYGCEQDFGRPLRMSPAKAETFLLDWLPRKIMLLPAEQHAMPHVLAAWVRWAGRRRELPAEAIEETLDAVFNAMGTFARVYHDPTTFGLDAQLVARLLPDADLEALPRRAFAFPLLQGVYDGIDLSTLDPARPEERRTLLAADHDDAHARPTNEQHISRHLVLSDRLWRGDPPELWEAAQRLLDRGEHRHAVQHTLMYVIRDAGGDTARLAAELANLP